MLMSIFEKEMRQHGFSVYMDRLRNIFASLYNKWAARPPIHDSKSI